VSLESAPSNAVAESAPGVAPVHLADYLERSAVRFPERPAIVDPAGRQISYTELNRQADALAQFLAASGVQRGDRVGVVLPKGIPAVVALFGIMKAGAAYVPVDYTAPVERARKILADCRIRALVADARSFGVIPEPHKDGSGLAALVAVGSIQDSATAPPDTTPFDVALEKGAAAGKGSQFLVAAPRRSGDLAYILYTSGSTGVPKGVMLTHENATSFVEWCSSVFTPTEHDRFSSHAPFHFDLSVLDVYLAVKHGAALYLVSEDRARNPKALAAFIAANHLTIWYSTPSILTLLLQFGNLPLHDVSSLRLVLFAGEVFPVKHLRELQRRWPSPAYYNLYGPTETNVCTFARVPPRIPDDRDTPYPIGFPCAHCRALALDDDQQEVAPGEDGLLYIGGPSVFAGYWNRPAENAAAFIERDGSRWYNTGDVVRWSAADGFAYMGRKDRMVKRRGYRIELGEIERALHLEPRLRDVAVVSVPDDEAGVKIVAVLTCHADAAPSIVELKTFCGKQLPAYMSPDRFVFRDRLPTTSTDKVDYQALRRQLLGAGMHSGRA
jgi:amino acid adenylation domain-containing protein